MPSRQDVTLLLRQLADRAERRHALLVLLDIPIVAIGAIAGGLSAGLLLGAGTATTGSIAGGLLLWRLFGYDEKRDRRA